MKKFEYIVLDKKDLDRAKAFLELYSSCGGFRSSTNNQKEYYRNEVKNLEDDYFKKIGELGSQGWEITNVEFKGGFIFKREIN